ncbi:MAG: ABC transporter ATP-binding protein [Xenococcaceae cyanobacterium MO_167.B52]|nr:ABC transporter ATP-binding protein [Xenococcaceae cyanobacterium MO_167.B52]
MTINLIQENTQESIWEDNKTILSVQNVSKKFCRSLKRAYIYGLKDITSQLLGKSRKSNCLRKDEFWALSDINLQLKRGESVGLIGVNGSGKTTLMRIIAGILKPDNGSIKVKGRLASLSVLGAGFNPILSGRENVYINMAILGLSKQEIDKNFQNVLDFAEIWDAIDAPVRTYSSGMKARLGFACAIYTNPDIMLIDEVLAVGDFSFRQKCYRKLSELRQNGVSFVLVSHAASAILSTCNSAIYLHKGKVVMTGKAKLVIKRYEEDLAVNKGKKITVNPGQMAFPEKLKNKNLDTKLQIITISLRDSKGNLIERLTTGKGAYICVECECYTPLKDASLNLIIRSISEQNNCCLWLKSCNDMGFIDINPGCFVFKMKLPYCGLITGVYSIKLNLSHNGTYYTILDAVESFKFQVDGIDNMSQCSYYQPRSWEFESR